MQHPASLEDAGHELARTEIEPELETDGTDRRLVVQAEARRRPQIHEAQIARMRKDVAGVDERDAGESLERRHAQLRVQHDLPVAARRESRRADGGRGAEAIEREASNRRVAAGEETLAG